MGAHKATRQKLKRFLKDIEERVGGERMKSVMPIKRGLPYPDQTRVGETCCFWMVVCANP